MLLFGLHRARHSVRILPNAYHQLQVLCQSTPVCRDRGIPRFVKTVPSSSISPSRFIAWENRQRKGHQVIIISECNETNSRRMHFESIFVVQFRFSIGDHSSQVCTQVLLDHFFPTRTKDFVRKI